MNRSIIYAAVQELLTSAAKATDLAAQLHDFVNGEPETAAPDPQSPAAMPAAKPHKARGTAPKAGRKAKGKGRVRVRMRVKGLSLKVTSEEKPNGKGGHPEPAPEPEKDTATAQKAEPENGAKRHEINPDKLAKRIAAHPGMNLSEHARAEGVGISSMLYALRKLVGEKRAVRQGGGYFPAEAETEASVQ